MLVRKLAILFSLLISAFTGLGVASPAHAVRSDSVAVLSPVAFEVQNRPSPVLGADNRRHMVYEILAINQSPLEVDILRIAPRAQGNRLGMPLSGAKLAERMRINSGATGTVLGPGESAIIFVDATYSPARKRPKGIAHAISLGWNENGDPAKPIRKTFVGVASPVSRYQPIAVASPLRGPGWVAANGCCTMNPHRGATLAIDGTIRVPERFAIDFVQLDSDDKLFNGPLNDLSSYAFYGAPIRSVAPGTVVGVRRNLPEQVPGALPAGATIQMAGGNHVVVKIGPGRFAFYAHIKTGSLRVRKGQKVKTGQLIGELGNTGNTDGPHLHFHIMDSPSPLQSNGLPFVFKDFRGQGVVGNVAGIQAGETADIDRTRLRGRYKGALPMEDQLLRFGK